MKTPFRALAIALVAGLALLLGAGPALAHAQLLGSDPADGASLSTGPSTVTIRFSDRMQPGFNTLTVIGPDDAHYETGDVIVEGTSVSIAVHPLGPAGVYRIGYRVVSDDGHPVQGSTSFTLTTPGPGGGATAAAPSTAPAAAAAENESGGMPIWPWIIGAVVVVGGGIAVALRLGRG
ncbi:copper resistance protein CopC [Pseudonocardia hispaniensis]|uniref:Copper resistance protein CopC n=1 Tax=Pseudonocardia hispaniensis TaxID=904933 RepID=A0ABW1J6E0_9PSEU